MVEGGESKKALSVAALCLLAAVSIPWLLHHFGHPPPVGVYIAVLGGLAAVLTFRKEPGRREKAIWILVITALIVAEIVNLYHEEHEQELRFKTIAGGLSEAISGLDRTIKEGREHFDTTISGLRTAINTVTGGNSVCYLDFEPALNNVAVMVAFRIGDYPLRGVSARIFDQAKWQAALTAYVNSKKPQTPSMEELEKFEEQNIGETRQPIRDFATPTRVIGGYQMTSNDTQSFQIVFGSFNAEWMERLEMRRVNGKWTKAMMVELPHRTPCFKIDADFPRVNGKLDVPGWPRTAKGQPWWEGEHVYYCPKPQH